MQQPREQSHAQKQEHQESLAEACFTGNAIALNAIDLSVVTEKIRAHNENIGVGPTLGRLLLGIFQQTREIPRSEVDPKALMHKALGDEDARRSAMQASFEAEIMPTLAAVGLRICPINKGWSINGPETNFQSNRLAFYIDNPAQFHQYLECLEATTMTLGQKRGLITLLQSLCNQLRKDYDVTQADDRLLALVSASESITSNYERLGMTSTRFNKYVDAIRGRYLRDLVLAEQLELDKPFEQGAGFNLRWHRDCVPSTLEQKWAGVLEVLVTLANNPKASELFVQASETAKAANKSAIREVTSWSCRSDKPQQDNRDDFLKILRRTELRLTEF